MSIPAELALNVGLFMSIPVVAWATGATAPVLIATAAASIAAALVFTAMEPGYHEWSPTSRTGRCTKQLANLALSLRSGRGNRLLGGLFSSIMVLTLAAVLLAVALTAANII